MTSPSAPTPVPETTETHPLPKAKLTAVSRFRNFAGGLSLKREPKIVFPPPSWFITDEPSTSNSTQALPKPTGGTENSDDGGAGMDVPEPTTFAMKIRQMIDSLPLPASVSAVMGTGPAAGPAPANGGPSAPVDDKGPPIPDIVDARTMRLLSSENLMNGDDPDVQGARRKSVWSELERMKHGEAASGERGAGASSSGGDSGHGDVMMYAPLEPTPDSEVELAESELEYFDEPPAAAEVAAQENGKGKGKAADTSAPPTSPPATLEKHWVPSTTKISVLTTWWGYRLYLPPPVMATLDSNQLKATQRAAMITTALGWFLRQVPMMILPPQVKPAVKVLRRLSPLLGYIGVFIAWSWTRISACDKGNGVVLTATWLLPVALIPMAWDAGDIHGPPNRPRTPKVQEPSGAAAGPDDGTTATHPKDAQKGQKKKK
ncbi:hypothetical protein D9615_001114 [Tricholomella constricta]|uniref:Uncharacterized protein n=1 Tax=Tricholomella constricta TaxID=117010 RepID=A0A8H5HLI3_9AGAR|nr:hypothetical protein D9615_001114 [Tricholomella constricta]